MSRRERPEVEQRVIPAGAPDDPERFKSPRRGMAAAVLVLEGIILGLTAPVLVRFTEISTGVAVGIGVGLGLACVLTSGLLRKEWGYGVGWALQVAALALGFLVPAMFFLGAIFAALWATADLMGRKIERERGEAWAAYDAAHPAGPASSQD